MLVRRCAHLFVELDCEPRFEFRSLLAGGDGLERAPRWLALAAHRETPVEVELAELAVLQAVSSSAWMAREDAERAHGAGVIERLLAIGLLIGDQAQSQTWRERDERIRSVPWWPLAAIAHSHGRWHDIDTQQRRERGLGLDAHEMLDAFGPPPTHDYRRRAEVAPLALATPERGGLDALLDRRRTCRNFASDASVDLTDVSQILRRVFGAIGTLRMGPGTYAVKKSSPAGGGLHCIEAYLVAQRVAGLAPGLYHYLATEHALESLQPLTEAAVGSLAYQFVAGQSWFANAAALVVMTARFDRLFWKYRRHAKSWRVAHLDAGHLSQTLFLCAAERDLGGFITAAVNDHAIEQAFELEAEREGVIAVCGFGPRSGDLTCLEMADLEPTPATLKITTPAG